MIFSLSSSAIPPNAKVAGFRGSEKISRPYAFDVYFTIESLPGIPLMFDLSDAVYAKATLTVTLGTAAPSSYSGILSNVRLLRAADGSSLFVARLVPQLWQLSLTKHSRIWTKKKLTDVLAEVLAENGVDHELRLQGTYDVEEMITQYKESDLDFIQRWMDREGMYYFFEQTDGADVLVITDNKAAHTSLRTSPVRYFPQSDYSDVSAKQSFDNFTASHRALPASVRLIDYDYSRPLLDVSSSVDVAANAVGEIAEYGGRFFNPQDAQRLATIRAQEHLRNKTVFEATGAATSLSAGFTFTLEDHPLGQYNSEYLVKGIEHYGYDSQFGPAWGSIIEHKYNDIYRVELTAISTEVQYRHGQRTPWPRVDGYENALVDGPATSKYAQIDDQGRYAIKFKFDEGTYKDGKGSTYVRMMQPHGGPQEGHHFPLRKGVEVICTFLGGDPDRPVINGVVHNMLNQSVVTQNNYTQNIIRTGSLNHIVMEDTAGQMFIDMYCPIFTSTLFLGFGAWNFNLTTQGCGQIQTTLNLNIDVDEWWTTDVVNFVQWDFHNIHTWNIALATTWTFNNILTWKVEAAVDIDWNATLDHYIKGAATILYDATLGLTVTADTTYAYNANHTLDIAGTNTEHVVGHESYLVDGGRDLTINAGDVTVINGGQTTTVNAGLKETVNGGQITKVNAGLTETVTGGKTTTITGAHAVTVNGSQTVHVTGSQSITVDSPITKTFLGLEHTHTSGMKLDTQLGLFVSASLAAKIEIAVGLKMGAFAGVQIEATAALKAEFNAVKMLTGGPKVEVRAIVIII